MLLQVTEYKIVNSDYMMLAPEVTVITDVFAFGIS